MKELFTTLLKDERGRHDLMQILRELHEAGYQEEATQWLSEAIRDDDELNRDMVRQLLAELADYKIEVSPAFMGNDDYDSMDQIALELERCLSRPRTEIERLNLIYQWRALMRLTESNDELGVYELWELRPLAPPIVARLRAYEGQKRQTLAMVHSLLQI